MVSIDVSPLTIGNHILNVVPKPSSPPMLPKSTIFEVFDLSSTIETAKEAKDNAKTLNTASITSDGGISILTIIATIFSSIFSYSAVLKVGLTIKLLRTIKLVNFQFGMILDSFFEEFGVGEDK